MSRRRKYPKPKVGDQYGEWTVVEATPGPLGGLLFVRCQCSCGRIFTRYTDSLVRETSSCCHVCNGERLQKIGAIARTQYGFLPQPHRLRLQHRVHAAIRRCHNPHDKYYARYGGRGISVYPAWRKDIGLFLRYLVTLDGWKNPDLQMDRVNNDGNYEPGNLRFVTGLENNRNKSLIGV